MSKISIDYIGKTVRVEYERPTAGDVRIRELYLGDRASHLVSYIGDYKPQIASAVIFAVLGVTCIILGIVLAFLSKGRVRLDYMGWAMGGVALWNLSQSDFRDFIFPDVKAISLVPVFSIIVISMNLGLFLNELQENRYKKIYHGYIHLVFTYSWIMLILQLNHIMDFFQGLYIVFGMLYGLVLGAIVSMFFDLRRGKVKDYAWIAVGFVAVSISGVIQMVTYVMGNDKNTPVFFTTGFLILTIVSYIQVALNYVKNVREKRQAELSAEMKARFLANMSHEIRTPINAILGINEMIMRESTEASIKEYASDVNSAGKLLLGLINDILDFSKMDSGKLSLNYTDYSIKQVILDCYNLIEKRAEDKGLLFVVEADPGIPSKFKGDDIRIKQIIINLLTNAVKYTEGGRVIFQITGKNIDQGNYLLNIKVTDTGMGIKKESIDNLFDSFSRGDENMVRSIEGTGLGLAITANLVEMMGGTIEVDSVPGLGSTFSVSLPQQILDTQEMGDLWDNTSVEMEPTDKVKFVASGANILVVDDVPLNLKVCEGLLKETGMNIDTASGGNECIALTMSKKYDVILLDHMMPGMDGIETFKQIKSSNTNLNTETPVIMLTANVTDNGVNYLAEGFAGFLAKPFSMGQLQEIILRFLPKEKIDEE